jgi:hypothetical protein
MLVKLFANLALAAVLVVGGTNALAGRQAPAEGCCGCSCCDGGGCPGCDGSCCPCCPACCPATPAKADCCAAGADCCDPPQACCAAGRVTQKSDCGCGTCPDCDAGCGCAATAK